MTFSRKTATDKARGPLPRRTRPCLEQLEPRDLPSTTGFTSIASLPAVVQKQLTSELVMEFMVAVSSGASAGLAQGILPISSVATSFPPSVTPPSFLRGAPPRMTLGAGAVLGELPTSVARAVAEGTGGTVATFDTPDLDDSDADDTLSLTRSFSHDLVRRADTPPVANPAETDARLTAGRPASSGPAQL